jgi:prepilin-type N-terminal cleavage/methylation domain-containing protein/prepilin-type processing-associated H-X9-DG protein
MVDGGWFMNHQPFTMCHARRGFTLIELLVVVAIISLLAAMLLPALQRAKESGRRSKCMANLKQIGVATQLYLDDHGGAFPEYPSTTARIAPYLGFTETGGALSARLNNTGHVFYCPSAQGRGEAVNETFWEAYLGGAYRHGGGKQCYGYNTYLADGRNYYGESPTPIRKLSQVTAPLSTVLWAADAGSWQYDLVYAGFLGAYRHGGSPSSLPADLSVKSNAAGFNASFLDGHVEWVPWAKFYKWNSAPQPFGPWNPANPYSWF